MQYLNELDIKNKRLLIRVDLNVPLDNNLNITDDNRIRGILPTVNYALDENAMVILCSHMGRPKGESGPGTQPGPGSPPVEPAGPEGGPVGPGLCGSGG